MTYAERAQSWNEWYDGLPDRWRFQVILWPLLLLGTLNMMLTIGNGFPFGLLVILGILFFAFVRVPYKAGWIAHRDTSHAAVGPAQTVHLGRVDWAWNLNQKYDAMPEWRQFWVFPAVLIVAGGINMALTLAYGFPFALLFLLALLAIVAIRAPYVWGWLAAPGGHDAKTAAAPNLQVAHDTTPPIGAYAPISEPTPATSYAPPRSSMSRRRERRFRTANQNGAETVDRPTCSGATPRLSTRYWRSGDIVRRFALTVRGRTDRSELCH